jgi:DNA repair exonuclease SbcCD ATPase subunit
VIKSLILKNFRSHKKSKLVFHKGINIIKGTSGHGKTNIIRALNWAINNKPSGERYKSFWGGTTKVKLKLEDKYIIREKGKGNYYKIEGLKKPLASFNKGVPDEINKIINFSSLNLQGQHNAPFLLALSGGEVAKYLNKIVQLDKIDLSQSNINSTLRREQSELKYNSDTLKEQQENINKFNWIDEAEGCLVNLETFQRSILEKRKECIILKDIINKVEECDEEIKRLSKTTIYEDEVNKLIKKEQRLQKKKKKAERLKKSIENIETLDKLLIDLTAQIMSNEKKFNKLMPDICPLCERGD